MSPGCKATAPAFLVIIALLFDSFFGGEALCNFKGFLQPLLELCHRLFHFGFVGRVSDSWKLVINQYLGSSPEEEKVWTVPSDCGSRSIVGH